MKFNINTAAPKEEHKSELREVTRSLESQGKRCDQDLCKADRLAHKDDGLDRSIDTLKLKIDNDHAYRSRLSRVMINVSSHATPAKFLKSQLHRYAYTEAVRLGEIDQGHLGQRAKRDYIELE